MLKQCLTLFCLLFGTLTQAQASFFAEGLFTGPVAATVSKEEYGLLVKPSNHLPIEISDYFGFARDIAKVIELMSQNDSIVFEFNREKLEESGAYLLTDKGKQWLPSSFKVDAEHVQIKFNDKSLSVLEFGQRWSEIQQKTKELIGLSSCRTFFDRALRTSK
ncbi:MAG: hypothetical protein AB7F43_09675 [Bacteriovoracia bacterium]